MSILIKGMEMPQEKKITLTIFPDGRVYENHGERLWGHGEDCIPWKAVPVPPHGRLIDADALMARFEKQEKAADEHGRDFSFSFKSAGENCAEWWSVQQLLFDAPTIIEAEEGE